MASITHSFALNAHAQLDGARQVMLRITSQRQHRYVSTSVYATTEQFNTEGNDQKRNWIRKAHPQHLLLNETLHTWYTRIDTLVHRLVQIDPAAKYPVDHVKDRLLGNQDQSLSAYIEAQIAVYDANKQDDNARNHRALLNSLRKFLFKWSPPRKPPRQPRPAQLTPPPVINLSALTPSVVTAFETWLQTVPTGRGGTTPGARRNYATDRIRRLRQHITAYIAENHLPSEMDPTRAKRLPTTPVSPVRLTEAELTLWEDAVFPIATKSQRTINAARLLYVASYYLHGIRAGDLISARVGQLEQIWDMVGGRPQLRTRFVYTSDKKDVTKTVLVEPFLLDLLAPLLAGRGPEEFIFPFLPDSLLDCPEDELGPHIDSRVSYVNKLLKKVSSQLGTNPRVTMHTARHTFAEHLFEHSRDLRQVQNALGQQEIATTQRYVARFKQSVIDEANDVYARRRKTPVKQTPEEGEQKPFNLRGKTA